MTPLTDEKLTELLNAAEEAEPNYVFMSVEPDTVKALVEELKDRRWLAAEVNKHVLPGEMDTADSVSLLMRELRTLRSENSENARLLGMSGERELALRAKVERLEKAAKEAANCLDWSTGSCVTINGVQSAAFFALARLKAAGVEVEE